MNAERVRISQEFLQRFENEGDEFLYRIITGDETSRVNHIGTRSYHNRKKFETQASAGKVMLTAFFDVNGVILADFMERGTTINSERYIESLNKSKKRFKRVRNENLQQDNATPHSSARTRDAIEHLGFSFLPHPPYSPDLAPSDFHLFPKLKEHLRGQYFGSDE
jgi:histone-lysine N-methyltransferase SETMAR